MVLARKVKYMLDGIGVLALTILFAACLLYVQGCSRLKGGRG
jgi:hypothetical protein